MPVRPWALLCCAAQREVMWSSSRSRSRAHQIPCLGQGSRRGLHQQSEDSSSSSSTSSSSALPAKKLLVVYHTQSGNTEKLARAVVEGAAQFPDEVQVTLKRAFDTRLEDLLEADGLLIGTPENFGYMSGAIKDLFDRTYYPAEGKMTGRPYAVFVSAGNDGTGAMSQIHRIAKGYTWKKVLEGHISRKAVSQSDLEACRELGATMAGGLSVGSF